MLKKIIKRGSDARKELIKGVNFLADCVQDTLGPFGSNFLIEKGNKITNDGVTVAKEIILNNEVENRGARILQEAASKTNDMAGDGTTTAIVLARAILRAAIGYLGDDNRGIIGKKPPIEVINQIERERKEVTEKLIALAKPIVSENDLINSAKVSVEDEELGEIIGKGQWALGEDGVILVEETAEKKSTLENVHGLRIDNGFGTSVLINNQEKQTLEINETRVILTNYTLKDLNPLKNVIDQLVRAGNHTITIIARAFTPECIKVCLENINKGVVQIYPINAPYTDQNEIMQDLATLLGAKYIHDESNELVDLQYDDVGYAKKIVAQRFDAIIAGNEDDNLKKRVAGRIEKLEEKLKGAVSDFEKQNLERRIAQLKNGFALLRVGANSETERRYKKDKCDDAVNAVRAAYQEGVVDGAGLAFKQIADGLPDTYLLKRPLLSVYEQIKFTAPKDWQIPEWVKDPVKVLRIALENACSVAGTLATAAGVICNENPKPKYVEEVSNSETE